jgi:hypothetical protein
MPGKAKQVSALWRTVSHAARFQASDALLGDPDRHEQPEGSDMPDTQHQVAAVSLPPESRVTMQYAKVDPADAYSIELPAGTSKDPEVLARFIFSQLPPWMRVLMKMRDTVGAGFGLKTARQLTRADAADHENRVGIFKVYSREPAEIILGEDDKHLDFRLSVLSSDAGSSPGRQRLILSTVVHCHNRLGRIYLFIIAPFHRLLVKSSMRHAARMGWPTAA